MVETKMSVTDMRFTVPWGHLSGKLWGETTAQPVLALHGLLDNCGAFDRIIPQLVGNYCVLALDLPGHGLSSHFPSGSPIYFSSFILATKYVIDELQWKRFFFVGHSLGGLVGLYFSACFPTLIEKLIIIDTISTRYIEDNNLLQACRLWVNQFMNAHERLQTGTQPSYSYEKALNMLISHRDSYLTPEAAEIIAKRSLEKTNKDYLFRMDQRLKLDLFPTVTTHLVRDGIKNLQCAVLFVYSTERYELLKNVFSSIFEVIFKKPNINVDVVDGGHEFHQNTPEKIVKLIDEFFLSKSCKL